MLSTAVIKNVGQASSYFMERDDYYSKEGESFEQPSKWYGKGAEKLKLSGIVDKETFDHLLMGKLPNGTQIGLNKAGEIKHRAGFDLTLSVPKSWSIAHYATKNPLFAHITEQAAQLTADLIERDCAMASRVENGKQVAELTGNLLFAFHYHRLSREGDMQDHIHINVMNMTQRKDGQWRALKSDDPRKPIHEYSDGFLERVRARKKHYGDVFSLHIAHLAQKNNLAVEFDQNGKWELKGISKEMIDAFSTRRKQIEQHMAEKGVSSAGAAEASALATRRSKANLSKNDIETSLDQRLSAFPAIEMKNLQSPLLERNVKDTERAFAEHAEAEKAIDYAIAHLSETAEVLTEEKLLVCAMKQFHAKPSPTSLLDAIAAKEQQKALYVLEDKGCRRFVSAFHVEREKEILSFIPDLKNVSIPWVTNEAKFQKWLAKSERILSFEQKSVINTVLKSKDLIQVIDSKTSNDDKLVSLFSESARFSKLEPIILCLSKKEAEDRQLITAVPCMSVSRYLHQTQGKKLNLSSQLLIVEQAHRLSTKQGHQLLAIQNKCGNRSILLYDSKQPQSLQPGHFIKLLTEHGISVEKFNGPLRENNILSAVRHEVPEKEARLDRIASDYVTYRVHEPQKSVLILGQNKTDVEHLNQKVQAKLLSQGLIGQPNITLTHYQPVFMTAAQLTQANQYKQGQCVSFAKNYSSLGVKNTQYYRIERISDESNQVWLRAGKNLISWDPNKIAGGREGVIKVFAPKSICLHEGDRVITSATCQDMTKDRFFSIYKMSDKSIVLMGDNKKKITLKNSDERLHHLMLGYAKTASSAHTHTPDVVLAEQTSGTRVTHAKIYYQILNQAKERVDLYTDDLDKHSLTLAKYKGEAKPIVEHLLEKCDPKTKNDVLAAIDCAAQKEVKREQGLSSHFDATRPPKTKNKDLLYKLAKYTVSNLSEREAVLTKHQLEQMIVEHNKGLIGQLNFQHLDKVLDKLTKKGTLIPCTLHGNEAAFTTKRAMKLEAGILQDVRALMGSKEATYNKQELALLLKAWQAENKALTQGQTSAIEQLLLTNNKLTLINGFAGVGKTTLLEATNALLKDKNIKLTGLAPTNEAVRQLKIRGIEAHTLDSYLGSLAKSRQEGTFDPAVKEMLVLDEASMASSKKFSKLLSLTKDSNISLAFIGDVKQLPSIELGKMFWQLQKLGVETTLVDEVIRQKDHPAYLALIKKIYQGDFKGSIGDMDKMGLIHEDKQLFKENPNLNVEDPSAIKDARLQKLVDLISSRGAEGRNNTCVIAPANKDRNQYNLLFREALKKIGELDSNERQTEVLVQADLTPTEKPHAMNYRTGQILLFHRPVPDCEIKLGDYLTVNDIDYKKNYLVLENDKGEKTGLNVARLRGTNSQTMSVYELSNRALAQGDQIRWRYTDKSLDRINMQQAKIIDVSEGKATVQMENNQTQVLDLTSKRDQHWDYAYASTVFTEQGNTKQFAALYMTSDQKHLASQPGFLVAMTRAIESGVLVTDDKDKLVHRIEQTSGIKTSSLESLNYQKQDVMKMDVVGGNITKSSSILTKVKERAITQKENEI